MPQVNGQNVVKVGHRQVVNMIRQGGNTLMVKVVMVTRHPDMDEAVHKKGAPGLPVVRPGHPTASRLRPSGGPIGWSPLPKACPSPMLLTHGPPREKLRQEGLSMLVGLSWGARSTTGQGVTGWGVVASHRPSVLMSPPLPHLPLAAPQQAKRLPPPAISLRSKSMTSELEEMGEPSGLLV